MVIEGHESFEQEYKIDCSSPKSELKVGFLLLSKKKSRKVEMVGFSASKWCKHFVSLKILILLKVIVGGHEDFEQEYC